MDIDYIAGHRYLCDNGLLHCDINAGNVLLTSPDDELYSCSPGFITDLDYARIRPPSLLADSEYDLLRESDRGLLVTAENDHPMSCAAYSIEPGDSRIQEDMPVCAFDHDR